MFSMPPAIATRALGRDLGRRGRDRPAPEPHTRFTVIAGTCTGSPAPMEAWRAGFILAPAWMTCPITTVSTASAGGPARPSASRITAAPRSVAGVFQCPAVAADGVRTGRRTMSGFGM